MLTAQEADGWQYIVMPLPSLKDPKDKHEVDEWSDAAEEVLGELGRPTDCGDGYELVTIVNNCAVFKRPYLYEE